MIIMGINLSFDKTRHPTKILTKKRGFFAPNQINGKQVVDIN